MTSIKSVLIANRGEIACRIIRTLKRLGIKAVAVYATPDENALHCQLADEAYCIGPIPVEHSYLHAQKIIDVAKQCGADAIHPGYGFLSENAAFAQKCAENNIIFIGPSAKAIAQMAVKDEAKKIMAKAQVPTVPGYMGDNQTLGALTKAAQEIGYPIMLKAAKGGGGKGMRVVHKSEELQDAIIGAKRESQTAFGDDTLFIEKYLSEARHIEVQIFRDPFGNTVHLFERDCSLQRRHQKIIEESPAQHISDETKQKMYQAAILAANTIDYVGAGTIEFLYTQNNQFYFMEMNTRLQVEHPVTEMITGFDLVEWQILVASGASLPCKQEDIHTQGHAIEARIYAEDPYHQFLPATGSILQIMLPSSGDYRLDSGIQAGDKIGIYFDPLLAKMSVHAPNRMEAIQCLQQVLNQFHLVGITTNLPFLRTVLQDQLFQSGKVHTQYLESHLQALLPTMGSPLPLTFAKACLATILHRRLSDKTEHEDPYSPWHQTNAWRLNQGYREKMSLEYWQEKYDIEITHPKTPQAFFHVLCEPLKLDIIMQAHIEDHKLVCHFPSHQEHADFYIHHDWVEIFEAGHAFIFKYVTPMIGDIETLTLSDHTLIAPMPGIISKIWVKAGDNVKAGTKLLALEAMKMEHTLSAPGDGLIKTLYYQIGDQVDEGCKLIDFE